MAQDFNAASMFAVGFAGTSPSAEVLGLIRRGVSGVVLFARNVESAAQVATLVRDLKRAAGDRPLMVSVDQEGGRVARLREPQGFTEMPSMRSLGATVDVELARRVGAVFGRELRAVGIDLDFAPVLDVDTNPKNPVIADRSFGRDPAVVSAMGVAVMEGLQAQGVAACGKHFPGHGDTHQDSHLDLPRLPHDLQRLHSVELPPFEAAIRAGIASIMTAHVVFDAIDPSVPATMSRAVLDGLLRQKLGFDGLLISDDLEMKAVVDHYGIEDAVVRGAAAGVDLFLVCHRADRAHAAIDAIERAVAAGELDPQTVGEAARRISVVNARVTRRAQDAADLSPLRSSAHLAVAEAARRASDERTASRQDPTEAHLR